MTADTAATPLPLFYRDPQPLSSAVHGGWRLKPSDLAFAADAPFIPIVAAELPAAARCYPVVFTAGSATPVAIVGLERRNLFIRDGAWDADTYTPAYVRRYPFGFMATAEEGRFALAIDAASEAVAKDGDDGAPLFEDGEPSQTTRQALQFCDAFQGEAATTAAFCKALAEQGLLIDRRADATLPDGRRLGLDGFQVIDAKKLADLPQEVVIEWHRNGWLPLAYFHLASLERFTSLLNRQSAAATPQTAAVEPAA